MATTAATKVTPPEYAKRLGVSPDKVISWIRSGQLRAMDGSTVPGGRPRYLIDEADIQAFEQSRAVTPPNKRIRRRQAHRTVKDFV